MLRPNAVARPGVFGKRSFIPVARMIFLLRYCWPLVSIVVKYEPLRSGVIEATVPLVIETEP